jgi:ribosomal protein L37AE/L43A
MRNAWRESLTRACPICSMSRWWRIRLGVLVCVHCTTGAMDARVVPALGLGHQRTGTQVSRQEQGGRAWMMSPMWGNGCVRY